MSERLDSAIQIAREAGAILRDRFDEPRTIETKSTSIDLVTDVDRASDALLVDRITHAFPDDSLLTEEAGDAQHGDSGYRWVIDPLDGTTDYAHGFPHFAVSIGIELHGVREIGVVYDPIKEELFHAERGRGAQLNGKAIQVSETESLARSLLATGFAYDVHTAENSNLEYFRRFLLQARAIRRAGSAALDLCYVACGRFDGFWELSLHAWDVAAGLLIVDEAGGCSSDLEGGAAPASGAEVVAGNAAIHPLLLEVIRA